MNTRDVERIGPVATRILMSLACALALVNCGGGGSSSASSNVTSTLPSQCLTSDIGQRSAPWYYDQAGAPTFTYSYQYKRAADPNAPVVVTVNGGPGAPGIGTNFGNIPTRYGIIYTDARGVGCNAPQDPKLVYPAGFYKTNYLARDVIAVIKALNLTNYYLFGASYGSVHATELAYLIEQDATMAKPKAVIIEGILGKAFPTHDLYFAGIDAQWQRVKPQIDPTVLNQIVSDANYLGYSSKQWAGLIAILLSPGVIPPSGDYIASQLNPLANLGSPAGQSAKAHLDAILSANSGNAALYKLYISIGLGCRELWGTNRTADLVNGSIVGAGQDNCAAAGVSMTDPYDSANFKIVTPILYFQGANDPFTPVSGAQYHFNNQTKTTRVFVTVSDASHLPLDDMFTYLGCAVAIWDSILANPANFTNALNSCSWPYTLNTASPTP